MSYSDLPTETLLKDREGILRYLSERHTEWGFDRAVKALALIEAELIIWGHHIK